jgi:hypothetical protein
MMKYLIYGISRSGTNRLPPDFGGIDGLPLERVLRDGLCASVSRTAHSALTPTITRMMTYQRVVEHLHDDHTVIPMRFGCLLPGEENIREHLAEHAQYYLSLLDELEGCAEMGVRILQGPEHFHDQPGTDHGKETEVSGRAYLAARRDHYAKARRLTDERKRVVERYKASFSGLFVKCKVETPLTDHPPVSALNTRSFINEAMVSLYFLVQKKAIESFRQTFRQINGSDSLKHLLSGPWPPYNFVVPEDKRNLENFFG